jgi:hypothetical protein
MGINMILSLALLGIGITAYSISQLQQHEKLRWMNNVYGFWGERSWTRKYVWLKDPISNTEPMFVAVPNNWYYRLFKLPYKERFPLSATFLVNFTDGYHMCQSISFLSFAGAFSLSTGIGFLYVWGGILICHFTTYRLLQR